MNENCVFCKIIKNELPSSKIYEDDMILGFMNIRPVHSGECILIPKKHVDHFTDIEENLSAHIIKTAQKIANKIRSVIKPERVGYVVAGYSIPHAHLIIIPQYHVHDITCEHFAILKEGKIYFTDQHIPIAERKDLDKIADELRL